MRKKDEELKFIGIDGFEEIESIAPQRVKPHEQKPKSKQKSRHAAKPDFKAAAATLGSKLRPSKTKQQPIHSAEGQRDSKVYKKRAVLAVAATVTAAMLSLATAASALDGSSSPKNTKQPAGKTNLSATQDTPVMQNAASAKKQQGSSALYIDGKLIGAAEDGNALQAALDRVLADAKAGYDDTTTTEFAGKVELKPYSGGNFESVEAIMAKADGKLSVKLETDWSYETETDFKTETEYDSSQSSDYEVVIQEGVPGKSRMTIRLTYIDGMQTDAVITEEKVISEPVNEKKIVGSADGIPVEEDDADEDSDTYTADTSYEDNSYEDDSDSSDGSDGASYGAATGGFMWPVPHTHNITSLMEWRWGRMHNGIDIAGGGDYGMPFVASDGGTVIWAGNDGGGYGNYVMIDHGNGYITVYGHASELCCYTGQYVSQGETIGLIGSTGNSTGPHLHFEIRLNGAYQDPLGYVS